MKRREEEIKAIEESSLPLIALLIKLIKRREMRKPFPEEFKASERITFLTSLLSKPVTKEEIEQASQIACKGGEYIKNPSLKADYQYISKALLQRAAFLKCSNNLL